MTAATRRSRVIRISADVKARLEKYRLDSADTWNTLICRALDDADRDGRFDF